MKKFLLTLILVCNVIVMLYIANTAYNHLYPMYSVVTEINGDIVTITNNIGYMYCFEGAEDWCINDICTCIMYDNYTDNITDDIIIKIRYNGNIGQ